MADPYSIVDRLGQYLASVVPRPGRHEVQFYPLSNTPGQLIDEARITRHELPSGLDIVAATWLNEHTEPTTPAKKSTKKRSQLGVAGASASPNLAASKAAQSSVPAAEASGASAAVFAVALSLGEIWTYLPLSDARVAQVAAPEAAVSMTSSQLHNRVWVYGDGGLIFEVDVVGGEATKTIRFGRIVAEPCTVISQCSYQMRRKRTTHDPQLLFLALAVLHLVDGARSRGYVNAEFMRSTDGRDDGQNTITHVHLPLSDGLAVVVARDSSSVLSLHDVADPSRAPVLLECGSVDIRSVRSVRDEYLVACTGKGTELFALRGDPLPLPVARICAAARGVVFENLYHSAAHGLVGVYYDGTQAKFALVLAELALEGTLEVAVDVPAAPAGAAAATAPDIAYTAGTPEAVANVPADALYAALAAELGAEHVSADAVCAICAANDREDSIRAVVRRLGEAPAAATYIERLFESLAARVAPDPARPSAVALWLRWVLLAHGGHVARQRKLADSVRSLQRGLAGGVLMMPRLLALQGRLQLLKAQAELRTGGGRDADADADADAEDPALEALNGISSVPADIEASVVYANGENDDFEEPVPEPAPESEDAANASADE